MVGARLQRQQRARRLGLRVVHPQPALGVDRLVADLGPVDLAVARDVHADRAAQVGGQHRAREVRPHRGAAVGVLAREARDVAHAADQVLDQVVVAAVLEVGGREVAEARGPDARALVHAAPGDRVVGAHAGDARADVVALLVERHQHVVRAAHVGGERVVLVAEAVAVGEVLGGRVVAVGDLDGREVVGVRRRVARHQRADRAVARSVPPRPRRPRRRPSSPTRASRRCRRPRGRTPRSPVCSAVVNSCGLVVSPRLSDDACQKKIASYCARFADGEDRRVADRRVAAARERAGAGAVPVARAVVARDAGRLQLGLDQLHHRGLDRLGGVRVPIARRP